MADYRPVGWLDRTHWAAVSALIRLELTPKKSGRRVSEGGFHREATRTETAARDLTGTRLWTPWCPNADLAKMAAPMPRVTEPDDTTLPGVLDAVSDAVVALHVRPRGPTFTLEDFRRDGAPKRAISVGARGTDIVLDDDKVSGFHCLIWREANGVFVEDSDSLNGTLVNGAPVTAKTPLTPGSVLRVGETMLVACGRAGADQRPKILADSLEAFLDWGVALYGSGRAAARAFGIASSTFAGWLRSQRFSRE